MGKQVTRKIGAYDSTIELVGQRVWEGAQGAKRVYMQTRAVRGHDLGCAVYIVLEGQPSAGDEKIETPAGEVYVKGLRWLSGAKQRAVREVVEDLFA